jgi:hypothetical protein
MLARIGPRSSGGRSATETLEFPFVAAALPVRVEVAGAVAVPWAFFFMVVYLRVDDLLERFIEVKRNSWRLLSERQEGAGDHKALSVLSVFTEDRTMQRLGNAKLFLILPVFARQF